MGIVHKIASYLPWHRETPSSLSPFYEACIRALKQQKDSASSAFSSILTVQDLISPSDFSIKKYSPALRSPMQKKLNKRTWELFKQAVITEIGEKKFHAICNRYADALPYKALETGAPFYLKYIKIFHLGLSQITEELVSNDLNMSLSEKELTKKIKKLYEQRCGPLGSVLENTPLHASSYSHLFQDQGKALGVLWSLAKQSESIPAASLKGLSKPAASCLRSKFIPWLEIFCKRVMNREFLKGQLIPVPGDQGEIQWYKVYAKIASCGLIAYALQPAAYHSSLAPLLVFRPTQTHAGAEDFLETLRNDLDSSIGKSGWLATESAFQNLMTDSGWKADDEKIIVAGFSLGGAHMQYFLSQYVNEVSSAYSFNAPGVDEDSALTFKSKIQRFSPFKLFVFRADKDLVPLVGKVHVGWDIRKKKGAEVHVIQGVFNKASKNWIQAHKRDLLSDPECHLHEIDDPFAFHTTLHNGENPHWLHRVHNRTGWLLSRALYLMVLIATMIERLTGIRLLRQPLQYQWTNP